MMSPGLLGFLRGTYLEFSQELWRRWADTELCAQGYQSLQFLHWRWKALFHNIPDILAVPLSRDTGWLKCHVRIQWVFWSGFFWKMFFLPILGLWRDSKIPLFFLNAAEFYRTWVCSFSFSFLHSVFLFDSLCFGGTWDWFADLLSPFPAAGLARSPSSLLG